MHFLGFRTSGGFIASVQDKREHRRIMENVKYAMKEALGRSPFLKAHLYGAMKYSHELFSGGTTGRD